MKRMLVGVALIGSMLLAGCYGSFNLTKKLHHWNGGVVGNKWGVEGIFFVITPAYMITTLADGLVINSIEFWTGDNPVSVGGEEPMAEEGGDG